MRFFKAGDECRTPDGHGVVLSIDDNSSWCDNEHLTRGEQQMLMRYTVRFDSGKVISNHPGYLMKAWK